MIDLRAAVRSTLAADQAQLSVVRTAVIDTPACAANSPIRVPHPKSEP